LIFLFKKLYFLKKYVIVYSNKRRLLWT